ncbi:MAG: FecCD family ABC transporter permease [Sphingomonadales bacterium]
MIMTRDESRKARLVGLGVAAFLLVLFVVSLAAGDVSLSLTQAVGELFHEQDPVAGLIVREIRLPRAILAILVGASLGMSGAALQGLLRNPLAEPGIIGVSSSAALGAVITFYFGLSAVFPLALPLGGIAGALLAVMLVYALAGRFGSILTIVLAGVAVSSFAGALTALALNLAPSPYAALEIVFWLLGSLADRSFEHIMLAAPVMAAGWVLILSASRALDALTLGEETAQTLGFDLRLVQFQVIVGTAFCVGAAVSVTGGIAFVGLVVPHLLRPLVGHVPSKLLPVSAVGGAALLLVADIAVRVISAGPELKVGVLTALIGAPFFLYLIVTMRRDRT